MWVITFSNLVGDKQYGLFIMKNFYPLISCNAAENPRAAFKLFAYIPQCIWVSACLLLFSNQQAYAQTTVTKQLYLSEPGQSLDRVDPVATGDVTTAQSVVLGQLFCGPVNTFTSPQNISNQFGGEDAVTGDLSVYVSPTGVKTLHAVFLGKDGSGDNKMNIYYASKTASGAWTAPVLISRNNWNQDAKGFPSIKVDANNKAHVVYAHKNGSSDNKINIYYTTNLSGTWSTPVRISSDAFNSDAFTPEIALDAAGKAYVVYQHQSSTDSKRSIYYVTNTSGSWSAPARLSNNAFNNDAGLNPAIAADVTGKAHVVFRHKATTDNKFNIYYTTNTSGSWSAPVKISDDFFGQDAQDNPSIAVDINSKPHVVYSHRNSTGGDAKINIYYVNKTGSSWTLPVNVSNNINTQDSKCADIGFCSNSTVRVAFFNNSREIYYTENSGAGNAWLAPVDINPIGITKSDAGLYPSIAVTENAVDVLFQDHPAAGGKIDIWSVSGGLTPTGYTTTSFTQVPALCSNLIIKAGTINVSLYASVITGSLPVNPAITAELKHGTTSIISFSNPVYNSVTGIITFSALLGADVTVPAGKAIELVINTTITGSQFKIDFDSQSKPSKVDFPVSTFINVNTLGIYNAAYPAGIPVNNSIGGVTRYVRAVVSDPFGAADVTGVQVTITPPGSTVAASAVATIGCTKIYEYAWSVPASPGTYSVTATAKEGYENTVTHSKTTSLQVCVVCPPSALNDSALGPGGIPVVVDVLANDSDPNNNLNTASLTITGQPTNGSALINNGKIVYIPNGTFTGQDTITYQVCDLTTPTPLCASAYVFIRIDPTIIDACNEARKAHTYFISYPENDALIALKASTNNTLPSNNVRTIISIRIPYPGMVITWDEWEDGYETNINQPVQSTTKIWGDGDIFNGIAPGYPNDIIPAGGSIVLDNTMPVNPRLPASIFYDGRDKVYSSGQIALTQVSGEPATIAVQVMKTNITSVADFGQSFTIPFGQNFNSQDFAYTSLFIRSAQNNTTVNVDKDNNGTFETTFLLNQGESILVNGGILTGATVASDKPIGVEVHAGGIDGYSVRNAPIFPATWYSNTYYTPVPTADVAANNPKDSSVVMLYNSLNRSITINWSSGVPASGSITIPAKSAVRFPLIYSTTAAYKFVNPTGESFTAIEIVDSYTPGGGGNSGTQFDWSFNLIAESRLTDYATLAWAPGSIDGTRNDNPVWVTPTANTTIFIKYNGDVINGGYTSPCGLRYDTSYVVNVLNYKKIYDNTDNDQGGLALYTCDGVKIAAVYGEDPTTAVTGYPSWDVGSTIQPFCKVKMIFAKDDNAVAPINQPVTIQVLDNDFGFLADINPSSLDTTGLLRAKNGQVSINANGTVLYTPNTGFVGVDSFEYNICSTPAPVVCDLALVIVTITACPAGAGKNIISGQVFLDKTKDGINNDGGTGFPGVKVYLYTDGNCNGTIDANELTDSVTVDSSGTYQFLKYPEKIIADNFDGPGGTSSCASGSDGNTPWLTNWVDVDAKPATTGFCITGQSESDTDVEIVKDGAFTYALRLDDKTRSATRTVNFSGVTKAFLTFSYRRAAATLVAGEDIMVQLSTNGTTFTTVYTIAGNGNTDAAYVTVYNLDISGYAAASTYLRFATNANVDEGDFVFFDDIAIRFLKYSQCYITKVDMSSVPAFNYITTVAQKNTSFANESTCVAQFDFGIARNSIGVAGNVYNDSNGLTDNLVNGPAAWAPGGSALYAYLVDSLGKVAFKSNVAATTGAFSFPLADVNTNYSMMVSATNVAQFANKPTNTNLPASWICIGEDLGVNNQSGSGIEPGIPNGSVPLKTALSNITNVKFGIERVPDSHDKLLTVPLPVVNQVFTLNGGSNPPVLSGTDGEDCSATCLLTGRNVIIDQVPVNSELYYNTILLTDGQLITNFSPSQLQLKISLETLGHIKTGFLYSFVDAAGVKDPTPSLYELNWGVILPVNLVSFSGRVEGCNARLQWITSREINADKFIVEYSYDGNYYDVANEVMINNSANGSTYTSQHNQKQTMCYYRLKIVDKTGYYYYSPVVSVQNKCSVSSLTTVFPNPVKSLAYLTINTNYRGAATIIIINTVGKIMERTAVNLNNEENVFPIDLHPYPKGLYLIQIQKSDGTRLGEINKLVKQK